MSLPSRNDHTSAMPDIAFDSFRRDTSQLLPSTVQDVIPTCAQPCLTAFVSNGYSSSVCPDLSDIFCLCSHYDNGGFTLGEGALSCIKLSCSNPPTGDLDNAYEICNSQNNHVIPTHSTLSVTVVLSSVPTAAVPSSSASPSAFSASNTVTTSKPPPTGTVTPTSSSAASTESAAAISNQGLSKAQIAGVVVAAVGLLVLIAGAAILIGLRFRRKKLRSVEESTDPFETGPPGGFLIEKGGPIERIPSPPKATRDPRKGQGGVGIAHPPQSRAPIGQQSADSELNGGISAPIGVAISADGHDEETPTSGQSTNTMSQLLPAEPKLVRQQQIPDKRPASNFSQATVFEEDNPATSRRVDSFVFPVPPSPIYSRFENPPLRIANGMASTPERRRQPSLTLDIPPMASKPKTATIARPRIVDMAPQPVNTFATPPKHKRRSRGLGPNARQNSLHGKDTSLQSSNDAMSTVQMQNQANVATNSQARAHVKKHASDQSLIETGRNSVASDTSFESGADDPTPPEEVFKRLSPVDESPISGIRYPKIPRSSNQIVPRRSPTDTQPTVASSGSPVQRSWQPNVSHANDNTNSIGSESTLLAKRRGQNARLEIERRLGIPPSNTASFSGDSMVAQTPKTASSNNTLGPSMMSWQPTGWKQTTFANALRTRASGSNGGREVTWIEDSALSPTTMLRSPMWEPRLTPTRRGDDLMLSVS